MARAQLPLRTEPLVDDEKLITLNWQAFFEGLASGDAGTAWTPTFVGLTSTGTPTITGKYYRITNNLAYFRIVITPATDTSAVNGTTYCDNFPLSLQANSANTTVVGFTAASAGTDASTGRIYTATWTAITSPVTICGTAECR